MPLRLLEEQEQPEAAQLEAAKLEAKEAKEQLGVAQLEAKEALSEWYRLGMTDTLKREAWLLGEPPLDLCEGENRGVNVCVRRCE